MSGKPVNETEKNETEGNMMSNKEAADEDSLTLRSIQVGFTVYDNEVKLGEQVGLVDGQHRLFW